MPRESGTDCTEFGGPANVKLTRNSSFAGRAFVPTTYERVGSMVKVGRSAIVRIPATVGGGATGSRTADEARVRFDPKNPRSDADETDEPRTEEPACKDAVADARGDRR